MKKLKLLLPGLMLLALLASCGNTNETSSESGESGGSISSETGSSAVSGESSGEGSGSSETSSAVSPDEMPGAEQEIIDHPTGEEECTTHVASYHSIPLHFIMQVGSEAYSTWCDGLQSDEEENIAAFVEAFDIQRADFEAIVEERLTEDTLANVGMTADEYRTAYGYTAEQIDAIYSGDAAAIETAFAVG